MATIVEYTSSATDVDYKMSLAPGEQLAREIGSDWNHIRIGLWGMISRSGANLSDTYFAVGVTSGTSSLYTGSNPTEHFVGIDFVGQTMQYYTNFAPQIAYYTSGSGRFIRKTGSLFETSSVGHGFSIQMGSQGNASPPRSMRTCVIVDVVKPPNQDPGMWTIRTTACKNNTVPTEISLVNFRTQLFRFTSSLDTPFGSYHLSSGQIPVSESIHGTLDTFNIYWNNSSNAPLHISEIGVYRIS